MKYADFVEKVATQIVEEGTLEKKASFSGEEIAMYAGEMLIDSLIAKQAATETSNEAIVIGSAAENALNKIGYTGLSE